MRGAQSGHEWLRECSGEIRQCCIVQVQQARRLQGHGALQARRLWAVGLTAVRLVWASAIHEKECMS